MYTGMHELGLCPWACEMYGLCVHTRATSERLFAINTAGGPQPQARESREGGGRGEGKQGNVGSAEEVRVGEGAGGGRGRNIVGTAVGETNP